MIKTFINLLPQPVFFHNCNIKKEPVEFANKITKPRNQEAGPEFLRSDKNA